MGVDVFDSDAGPGSRVGRVVTVGRDLVPLCGTPRAATLTTMSPADLATAAADGAGGDAPRSRVRGPVPAAALAAVGIEVLFRAHVLPWTSRWGATDAEVEALLPGDEMVGAPAARCTRAVTVDVPAAVAWAWLVGIGEGRTGFPATPWPARVAGAGLPPQWRRREVGDVVWLARRCSARLRVATVRPGSHLVLVSPADYEGWVAGHTCSASWAFVLRPEGDRTRLLVRTSGGSVGHAWFDVAHFLVERRMLRAIRARTATWTTPAHRCVRTSGPGPSAGSRPRVLG